MAKRKRAEFPPVIAQGSILRITSRRDGFRRGGMAHSSEPTDHPAGAFSEEEIEQLYAEPMLTVQVLSAEALAN